MRGVLRRAVVAIGVAGLIASSAITVSAGAGGVPNEKSCGGVGSDARTFAALPGRMDPEALFDAQPTFTCDEVGKEHRNSGF